MRNKDSILKELEGSKVYEEMKAHLYSNKPVLGEGSPFSALLQTLVNTMLVGEVNDFLESEKEEGKTNKRNGYTKKKVISNSGELEILTPRDRNSEFEPALIGKREKELSSGLDEQIMALYAQGNSIEDVRRLLVKMFGVEISSGKISHILDQILPELQAWRDRRLKPLYSVIYLDAIRFKIREEGKYITKAFYTVYAVDWEGERDLLGMYMSENEGSKIWGMVLEDLKTRGVEDILVVCTDDLNGFSAAINEVFPQALVQKCIVHQMRNSLKFVDDKDSRAVAASLRKVYTSITMEEALIAFEAFEEEWGKKYKYIVGQWREKWTELMAFMDFSPAMRKMIYTTNPVEALHRIMRKLIKSKAAWVSETALLKQLYLSLMHNEKSWKRKANGWKSIQRDLYETYEQRIQKYYPEMI